MQILGWIVAMAVAVGLGGLAWAMSRRFEGYETAPSPPYDDRAVLAALDSHRKEIDELQSAVSDQTLAISEGIDRVDRAERRIRSTVGRAKKRMAELGFADESLDAEAEQLRLIDGASGSGEELHSMSNGLAPDPPRDMTPFPGQW